MSSEGYRIAVVGATGQVGGVLLDELGVPNDGTRVGAATKATQKGSEPTAPAGAGLPIREIVPFASARSAGTQLRGMTVQPINDETIQGFDIAVFSAGGSTSKEWAPKFAAAGAVVVDNSSAWRMHDGVPLVVSEVNPEALDGHKGIVANPNCSTMQLMVALRPIQQAAGIERLVVSTYQAVSGTGKAAVDELFEESRAILDGVEPPAPRSYAHRIAFNALPHAGTFVDDHTDEELKLINETRKILGDETIRISATCVRVPVINGHSETCNVETREELSPERAREILEAAPGLEVRDDPAAGVYPMAIDGDGRSDVLVGRIRRDRGNDKALDLFVVGDNLRKGAATNTIQLALVLHERGLVRPTPASEVPAL
ncbi:aspartate-semialdehyde dehydrogenase [Patulibacter sp. NPDC049589]|uniref:aspartate-semialdehyde dehydrogenase n=1 Tax=Patulibacter sp. NPDC049589 TaxID=3154731 RepID=UPI003436CCAC